MGPTETDPDLGMLYHLDPWHKMQLGWVQPERVPVVTIDNPASPKGGSYYAASSETSLYKPVLFYDSRRGTREYLLVEYRENSGFDFNVAATGVAIWRVVKDTNGNVTVSSGGAGAQSAWLQS